MNDHTSIAVTSGNLNGITIQKNGTAIRLEPTELRELMDSILDSPMGPAFTMSIDTPDQIAYSICNNGNYNIFLRPKEKSKRCVILGVSTEAVIHLGKIIAEATSSDPSLRQQ